jgi:hypothetical protein
MTQTLLAAQQAPTLHTIIMVENTLRSADSCVSVAELKRRLPRQVNHNALKTILLYLEESGKIAVSMRGITWVHPPSRALREAIRKGTRHA